MQDIILDKTIEYRVGFRVYPGAKKETSEKGESEPIEIIIPSVEQAQRVVKTRKVKKKCEEKSQNEACIQCRNSEL